MLYRVVAHAAALVLIGGVALASWPLSVTPGLNAQAAPIAAAPEYRTLTATAVESRHSGTPLVEFADRGLGESSLSGVRPAATPVVVWPHGPSAFLEPTPVSAVRRGSSPAPGTSPPRHVWHCVWLI
jgi:hypothetical protein